MNSDREMRLRETIDRLRDERDAALVDRRDAVVITLAEAEQIRKALKGSEVAARDLLDKAIEARGAA